MQNSKYQSKLHIPEAPFRPGDTPDFSYLKIPSPEESFKPGTLADPEDIKALCYGMVRVLDDDDTPKGPWDPELSPDQLREALKHMVTVRIYDERMLKVQRQGRISFYIQSGGEEAVSVGQAMALEPTDMLFPAYRQQGLFITRGRNPVDMMCNLISNSRDNMKGRQMPTFYGWKEGNIFSISGNVGTQVIQAVGWGMASAYKGEDRIASTWIGDGSTAEADFYYGLTFGATYKSPTLINVVNNQWAISTPQTFASTNTTFAARARGFNLPGIRVDGNDFLAVYAVTTWAAERARQGGGPTLIEHFTYRKQAHSSSDNPAAYRPKDEAEHWPLGDPIERLKNHLINLGEWDEEKHQSLEAELRTQIDQNWREAESYGTLENGPYWPVDSMFEDVFKEVPKRLQQQRELLKQEQESEDN